MKQPHFEDIQTVRFQHCDPAGIVFYPRYYEMLNLTVEHFFDRCVGYSFNRLQRDLQVTVPTVRMETDFFVPSVLEDELSFQLSLVRIGRSSLNLQIECHCAGTLRLRALITLVCIDVSAKTSTAWPESVRAAIQDLVDKN
ncbi:thioesterase family protein [Planktotalea sp.]|uniref:acyl-CoA thioesterase n=1 Tax=Planktotalea sp. TaxID=2029877 RepID=UPI003299672C